MESEVVQFSFRAKLEPKEILNIQRSQFGPNHLHETNSCFIKSLFFSHFQQPLLSLNVLGLSWVTPPCEGLGTLGLSEEFSLKFCRGHWFMCSYPSPVVKTVQALQWNTLFRVRFFLFFTVWGNCFWTVYFCLQLKNTPCDALLVWKFPLTTLHSAHYKCP